MRCDHRDRYLQPAEFLAARAQMHGSVRETKFGARLVKFLAIATILHFSLSIGVWIVFIAIEAWTLWRTSSGFAFAKGIVDRSPWFLRSGEAFVLLVFGIASLWLLRRSPGRAAQMLTLTLGLAAILFVHDAVTANCDYTTYTRRYPVRDETCHYLTWWWYSHPVR